MEGGGRGKRDGRHWVEEETEESTKMRLLEFKTEAKEHGDI